jgi:hypothetical protein
MDLESMFGPLKQNIVDGDPEMRLITARQQLGTGKSQIAVADEITSSALIKRGSDMTKHVKLRVERTLPTYTRLRSVSWYTFDLAESSVKGNLHHLMTSMLFCAFTIEAFLNHLLEITFPLFWEPLKRGLRIREKLDVLTAHFSFEPDFKQRPFQTLAKIFWFRNLLVHAKTETLITEGEFILEDGASFPEPLAKWEELLTIDHARRFLDDTKKIVTQIAVAAGINPDEVFAPEEVKIDDEVFTTPMPDIRKPSS